MSDLIAALGNKTYSLRPSAGRAHRVLLGKAALEDTTPALMEDRYKTWNSTRLWNSTLSDLLL